MRRKGHPILNLVEVGKDSTGYCAKVDGVFEDGSVVFRWGIDPVTYLGMKKVTQQRYLDALPGVKHEYYLFPVSLRSREGSAHPDRYVRTLEMTNR